MIQTYWPMYSNVSEIEVAGILNILLNLKKGTKMMQYFFTTLTTRKSLTLQKLIYCLPFTYTKSV